MSLWDTFFLKSPISYPPLPLKSQMVGPLGLLRELRGRGGNCVTSRKNVCLGRRLAIATNTANAIACVAGVRKGREGNLGATPRARNLLSVPF